MGFFQGTEELVRNSRGKRAISVRAIEVLLYMAMLTCGVNWKSLLKRTNNMFKTCYLLFSIDFFQATRRISPRSHLIEYN